MGRSSASWRAQWRPMEGAKAGGRAPGSLLGGSPAAPRSPNALRGGSARGWRGSGVGKIASQGPWGGGKRGRGHGQRFVSKQAVGQAVGLTRHGPWARRIFRLPGPSKRASKAAFWRLRFQEAFQDEKSALGGPIWGQVGPPNGSKTAPKAVKNQVKFSIGSGRQFGLKNGP